MPTTLPIVLAAGIARFDFLRDYFVRYLTLFGVDLDETTDSINYYKGIAHHLRAHGFHVEHATVSFAAGVEQRAADLAAEVERVRALYHDAPQVHIIGHSMGGLDARHMIVRHGMAARVASLTTIGVPHWGTSFATWLLEHQGERLVELAGRVLHLEGLRDLTPEACRAFNEAAEADEAENDVRYQTFAGTEPAERFFAPLQWAGEIIARNEGANDFFVPVSSQQWQRELRRRDGTTKEIAQRPFPIPADHLNQIGWWEPNELRGHGLFSTNPLHAAAQYELSIRNVYLAIANEL
jgi:triacylglycerol lipase